MAARLERHAVIPVARAVAVATWLSIAAAAGPAFGEEPDRRSVEAGAFAALQFGGGRTYSGRR